MGYHPFTKEILTLQKVGVLDFTNSNESLKLNLQKAGFKKVSFLNIAKKIPTSFFKDHDLFVAVGSPSQTEVLEANSYFLKHQKSYLLIQIDNFGAHLGPQLGLQGGPCYNCLQEFFLRKDLLQPKKMKNKKTINQAGNSIILKTILDMMTDELIKIATLSSRPYTFDGYYEFDLIHSRTNFVQVGPSPNCNQCRRSK